MHRLNEPWTIGTLSLRNRLWLAPVKTAFGTPDGRVTARHLHFYRRVAQGGVGLVILEPVPVRWDGREHPKQLAVTHPDSGPELATIVAAIHQAGSRAGLHLNHAGRAANPKAGGEPKAPSASACPARGTQARQLERGEIAEIVQAFGRAAGLAAGAGFDLVEVQAGHGYLLQQFADPQTNQREDEYGRDRLLFARQVLEAVRSATSLPVSLRITLTRPDDPDERTRLAGLVELAESLGISVIHASMGDACTTPPWYYHHGSLPQTAQNASLRVVRSLTRLPLVAAGRMGDFARATRLVDEHVVDGVALGRPLVADPDLPAKWRDGAADTVMACGSCLQGCLARVATGEGLSCIVNPSVGQPPIEPAERKKRVLVVGAGPAGLSAALALRERGHTVTVVERDSELGGTFRAAPRSPGKESMERPLGSLVAAATRAGLDVRFNQEADETLVAGIRPDAVVWAAGAEAIRLPVDGLDTVPTLTSPEYYLERRPLPGQRVLVIGGGLVGVETAEKLANEGREVVVVELLPEVGGGMEAVSRKLLMQRIQKLDTVTVLTSTTLKRVGPEGIEVETAEGSRVLPPVDAVLLAVGLRPRSLPDRVRAIVPEVFVVGDAKAPRDVERAMKDGYEAALAI